MFHNLSALEKNSKGRLYEINSDHRLLYERDRDRIYHSTAFRKLKDKTQVFMFEKGDYYRNRLTHTLEVSQIARSVSRKFQLNEDLTECIALCHDLGHSPFGHVGEDIIAQELDQDFDHNFQSFRQVTMLEKKYVSYSGLNLSWETLDGLIKHNGIIVNPIRDYNLSESFQFNLNQNPSLEAQIASISDDIAYIAHDFDDGLRSEILNLEQFRTIRQIIHDELQPLHEEWANTKLTPTAVYGIRSYNKGATLTTHRDKIETHHISSIVIVDKDLACGCNKTKGVENDWALDIQDHEGNWHKVYAEIGDIILYESATMEHGRKDPFKGNYFRNFYVHYKLDEVTYVG